MLHTLTRILPGEDTLPETLAKIEFGELVLWAVLGIIVIALVTALAPRVGVAGPLVLVAIGIGVSYLPFVPEIYLPPDWILVGILPPLLYAAAVSLPAMEFRRDFGAIGGLSVVLVVISSLVLGLVFSALIPGLGLPLGIALGAVLSPTDAVATSIVKKLGISPRVVTMLEGESLLNDATALVLLKTAIAAVAGSFSLVSSIGAFSWSVVVAVAVGLIVGWVNLRVRAWVRNTTAATTISFIVPYVAFLPAEHLEASGLVAAVVAGIVSGMGSAKYFSAEQRLSDRVVWHTVELVLEGAVFLLMGLEVTTIVREAEEGSQAIGHAAVLALIAVTIVLVLRTLYVIPLVWLQSRRARRAETVRPRLERVQTTLANTSPEQLAERSRSNRDPGKRLDRFTRRVNRSLGDLAYLETSQLGWREGSIIVWAGMRGAVTLAAAQTLPPGHNRNLLVLVAFFVAVGTLILQGSTVGWLTRKLGLAGSKDDEVTNDQLTEVNTLLHDAAVEALDDPGLHREDGRPFDTTLLEQSRERMAAPPDESRGEMIDEMREIRLAMIIAQRRRLVEARSDGHFSTAVLRRVLESLDAEELSIRTHLDD